MLRLGLLGLLILLGVGVLSAMELRAPPRSTVAIVQPLAEPDDGISASQDTLAKADRLHVVAVSSETPAQAALAEEPSAPPDNMLIASPELPKPVVRQRHNAKAAASAVRPKPKPKAAASKRTVVVERSKPTSDAMACRLAAFGGLRKALNLDGCEI